MGAARSRLSGDDGPVRDDPTSGDPVRDDPSSGDAVREVAIADGEIRLGQFLKLSDLVDAGSDARPLLATGAVSVNGDTETRRGRRLHPGDIVTLDGAHVRVGGGGAGRPALFELGDPGPMRDRLVASVLRGDKTATSSLEVFYTIERMPLPRPGDRSLLAGSAGERLGTVEVLDVAVPRLADVGDDVAVAEGEGFRDAAEWRSAHEHYWEGFADAVRSHLRDPGWSVGNDTPVVVEWFRLVPPDEVPTD
jgi:uncharacterized protein YhfF/ribosome-associated protein YbcJ (S4-like RNA binding protein)